MDAEVSAREESRKGPVKENAEAGVVAENKQTGITSTTGKPQDNSDLDRHTDPFAVRKGKTLLWTNVNMTLVRKNSPIGCYFSPIDIVHLTVSSRSASTV